MERAPKGIFQRIIKEPTKEVLSLAWKLAAVGSVIAVALGQAFPALKLAFVAIAANVGASELSKSLQKPSSA